MRFCTAVLICLIPFALTSCSQQNKEHAERDAGKAAYHAAEGAKKAAEKAGHELRVAGEQAHQGWKEAKHEDKEKRK